MGADGRGSGRMYGYGVSYAIASLSCTIGAVSGGHRRRLAQRIDGHGCVVYLAYVAGLTLVVGVLAIAAATASSAHD